MAEQLPSKRQREVTQSLDQENVEESKRHKSYNHILSLLEAEEDEPNQDLSPLITTLQQELSSDSVSDDSLPRHPTTTLETDQENPSTTTATTAAAVTSTIGSSLEDYSSATSSLKEDEDHKDDDKERVIRHLLEASDDELGIPNREDGVGVEVVNFDEGLNNGGNGFALYDGLWELEDEAANYYTLLQSELFM